MKTTKVYHADMTLVRQWQKEKKELEDKSEIKPWRRGQRRQELVDLIETAFKQHHQFTQSKLAERFFRDCVMPNNLHFSDHHLDHCTFYKTQLNDGTAFALTSQPYGFDEESKRQVEEILKQWEGAYFIDTSEWVWWYPGSTSSFTLCFPRATIQRLRKQRQTDNYVR